LQAKGREVVERQRHELIDKTRAALSQEYVFRREELEQQLSTLSSPPTVKTEIVKSFEIKGADVELQIIFRVSHPDLWFPDLAPIRVEIKPTVGDDYPAVLRQMRRAETKVLFLEHYTGKGATREQFIQTFKTANIAVVFRDKVAGS
jgi:hypothetical protein